MSEVPLKPWMRRAEAGEPEPTADDSRMAYVALRSYIRREIEDYKGLDSSPVQRTQRGGIVVDRLEFNAEDSETISFERRVSPTAKEKAEYEITLLSKEGIENKYIGNQATKQVVRYDATTLTEAEIESTSDDIDREIAILLGHQAGTLPPSQEHETVVGSNEVGELLHYIVDDGLWPTR